MEPKIKKTKNYGMFKALLGNRNPNARHIIHLIDSIKKNNLLNIKPIVVNGKMEVIDGQHRLAAAKELGVPIYYIIKSKLGVCDAQTVNTENKRWVMIDFLQSKCTLGLKVYLEVDEFAREYNLSPMLAVSLLSGDDGEAIRKFKDGTFRIKHKDWAIKIASFITDTSKTFPHYKSRSFIFALSHIFRCDFNEDRLRKCLLDGIDKCATKKQYILTIQEAYNYHLSRKSRKMFMEL